MLGLCLRKAKNSPKKTFVNKKQLLDITNRVSFCRCLVDNELLRGFSVCPSSYISYVSITGSLLLKVSQSTVGYGKSALADSAVHLLNIILHFLNAHIIISPLFSVLLQLFHIFSWRSHIEARDIVCVTVVQATTPPMKWVGFQSNRLVFDCSVR